MATAKLVYLGDYKIKQWSMFRIRLNPFEHREEIRDVLVARGARLMSGKFQQVLKAQDGICPLCQQAIFDLNTRYEIHHNWPKKWGGSDGVTNLWYIHTACHISYHIQNTVVNLNSKNARYYLEKYQPLRAVDPRKEYSDAVRALLSGTARREFEPCEGKLSRTVLWGESRAPIIGESADLPAARPAFVERDGLPLGSADDPRISADFPSR